MMRILIALLLMTGAASAAEPEKAAAAASAQKDGPITTHSGLKDGSVEETGTLSLKVMVVNPSDTEAQKVPIEIPLPREAAKRHIVEAPEGLDVRFDSDNGLYKLMGELTLTPGEQRTVQLKIQDIWKVQKRDLQFQKGYTQELIKLLSQGRYADTAKNLYDAIQERLDRIESTQEEARAPSKHIDLYRQNLALMDEIKKDVQFLEKLSAEKIDLPKALLESEDPNQRGSPAESVKTITLKMQLRNPSETEKALLPVDYHLPREVKEKDVINAGELETRYDVARGTVYLHKDQIPLEPGESKIFEVVVRDIWHVEPEVVKELQVKAVGMAQGFEGTKFEPAAQKMKNEIIRKADAVLDSQSTADGKPVNDHIAVFVENLSLIAEIKEKIAKMARVEVATTANPKITPQVLGMEGSPVTDDEQTPQVMPEIVARAMFKDKAPDKNTFWKIIFGIIGFLGFVSLLFYVLWWTQSKLERNMAKEEIQ